MKVKDGKISVGKARLAYTGKPSIPRLRLEVEEDNSFSLRFAVVYLTSRQARILANKLNALADAQERESDDD